MRVVVTGAGGMLGTALVPALAAAGHGVVGLARADLDVTDRAAVEAAFRDLRPELVLHTAAYTKVDQAESEPDRAEAVNHLGAAHVAAAAARQGARLVHYSTDYVFDGRASRPISVDAAAAPLGVYGATKWRGETAVRTHHRAPWILRTSWLYGAGGPNFVDTMRRLAGTQPEVRVVHDQIGSPTWTVELARLTLALVRADAAPGTYHAACQGQCSWYELARAIWDELELATLLTAIPSTELARPAPRPAYSVLDPASLQAIGIEPQHWLDALRQYLHGRMPQGVGPR